jgi:hypothetical protein
MGFHKAPPLYIIINKMDIEQIRINTFHSVFRLTGLPYDSVSSIRKTARPNKTLPTIKYFSPLIENTAQPPFFETQSFLQFGRIKEK